MSRGCSSAKTPAANGRSCCGTLVPLRGTVRLTFLDDPTLNMDVLRKDAEGNYRARLSRPQPAREVLEQLGRMPLPPYIRRQKDHDDRDTADRERYQTVYASSGEAIAAPTAGLHFTPELLQRLERRSIQTAYVTLNVGLGTFKPVVAESLEAHACTWRATPSPKTQRAFSIAPSATAGDHRGGHHLRPRAGKPAGRRGVRAKTSSTGSSSTRPTSWKHVSALITNFHLPRSTLIALVAALVGLDEQRRLYQLAIQERYRFFSYGDAMFIE